MSKTAADAGFLRLALAQARAAQAAGEVPVGAVLVHQGQVIATGHNRVIADCDPSAHAEIVALRHAGRYLGNYRLQDCELFVTLEPCAMCAGAIAHARLARVVYGVRDARSGAAGSVLNVLQASGISHQPTSRCTQDDADFDTVLQSDLLGLLPDFFQAKRQPALWPLRPDALRTPATRFAAWPETAATRYTKDLAALAGLRLHYWDSLTKDAEDTRGPTLVCLHDGQTWSQDFAHFFTQHSRDARVLVPDLPGFGRSDKPKKWQKIDAKNWWLQVVCEWLHAVAPKALQAGQVQWVVTDANHPLLPALKLALPPQRPHLCSLPPAHDQRRQDAPYPDAGHRTAQHAWQQLLGRKTG
jgi:tRNA(adenine34) deaminase